MEEEIHSNTIIEGDFNTPLTAMDISTTQKIKYQYSILTHIYGI